MEDLDKLTLKILVEQTKLIQRQVVELKKISEMLEMIYQEIVEIENETN